MSVLAQPNHPARLATLFAASVAATVIVASAIAAALYVVQDIRAGDNPPSAAPLFDVPDGFMVVLPLESAAQIEEMAGFAPFVPSRVPSTTQPSAHFAVTPEDDAGERTARVAFSAAQDVYVDGINGPLIVLEQTDNFDPGIIESEVKQLVVEGAYAVRGQFICRDIAVTAAFYYQRQDGLAGGAVTPYMVDVARSALDTMQSECGE